MTLLIETINEIPLKTNKEKLVKKRKSLATIIWNYSKKSCKLISNALKKTFNFLQF